MDEEFVEIIEPVRYRDEFYPGGFRKLLAIALVVGVTVLPEMFTWLRTPVVEPAVRGMPTGRFAPSGGFLPRREAAPRSNVLKKIWAFVKRSFIVVATTIGLILYYPRSGFKRYALLCGPVIAFLVRGCVALYLQGRAEVYRAEVLIVALVALAPGVALYVWLTWRKAKRLGMEW